MADLRLPKPLRQGIADLAQANSAAADELCELLSHLPPTFISVELADQLTAKVSRWAPAQFAQVFSALIGLALARKAGDDLPEFVARVIASIERAPTYEPEAKVLSAEFLPVLRERLTKLLALENFVISARAYEVLTSHQKVFLAGRIFSEIRPVFGESISEGPAAAVVLHQLKLEYREDNNRQEFFFALDTKDLDSLADVLKRAKEKDSALRKVIQESKIVLLEPK